MFENAVWKHYTPPTAGKAVCKTCIENMSIGTVAGKLKNT